MNSEENIEKEVLNIEKLVDMIYHLHNDIENVRRDLVMVMHKVDGVAFLHERTTREVEEAINSIDINLDEIYSPIDDIDRDTWKKHLEGERQERKKFEEL